MQNEEKGCQGQSEERRARSDAHYDGCLSAVFCAILEVFCRVFWGILGIFVLRKLLISRVIPRYSTKFHSEKNKKNETRISPIDAKQKMKRAGGSNFGGNWSFSEVFGGFRRFSEVFGEFWSAI
jgi:hypothetical protein